MDEDMRTLTSGERRHVALMCGIALAFGSGAVALAAVSASGPLHRKAGLWEQHLKIDDGSYPIPVATMCIDAKAEERLTLVGAQMDRRQCSSYQMTGRGDGSWSFLSVCEIDPGATVTTKGSATGDFRTTYSVEATGSTTGAALTFDLPNGGRKNVRGLSACGHVAARLTFGARACPTGVDRNVMHAIHAGLRGARRRTRRFDRIGRSEIAGGGTLGRDRCAGVDLTDREECCLLYTS